MGIINIKKNITKHIIQNWIFLTLGFFSFNSFGVILSPYETVQLQPVSMVSQIRSTNEQVQNNLDIPESIQDLVHRYTNTITKCSVDYESLGSYAVTHALIGVHAYHFAVHADPLERRLFFEIMSDLEKELSSITDTDCPSNEKAMHVQAHLYGVIINSIPAGLGVGGEREGIKIGSEENSTKLDIIRKVQDMERDSEMVLTPVPYRRPL